MQLRTGSGDPNATLSAKAAPEKAAPEKAACQHVGNLLYDLYDDVLICSDLFGFIGHGGNCLLLCDPVAQHNLRSVLSCRHQRSDRNRTLRHREQISHMYLPLYYMYIYNVSS